MYYSTMIKTDNGADKITCIDDVVVKNSDKWLIEDGFVIFWHYFSHIMAGKIYGIYMVILKMLGMAEHSSYL